MKERIRLQGLLIAGSVVLALVCSKLIIQQWTSEAWEEPLDILGVGFILLGFVWRTAARGHKAEHSANGHKLIQDGPYSLTRNPMYFGTLLIGVGVVALFLDIAALVIFTAAYLFIYIRQIKKEEGVLLAHFGGDFQEYCRRVPRFFPSVLSLGHWPRSLKIKSSWIGKEISSFAWVFFSVVLAEILIDTRLFGHYEFIEESLEMLGVIAAYAVIFGLLFFIGGQRVNKGAAHG